MTAKVYQQRSPNWTIEAYEVPNLDTESFYDNVEFYNWLSQSKRKITFLKCGSVNIHTKGAGNVQAHVGDFISRNSDGEFGPHKRADFLNYYQEVEPKS